ncbi:MAG TPA: phosphate ABC transporter permease subunit PstC [Acidimicrobiales bacterium]|nr:phosphate ABC transporter permease subunit PstC [Acidimicrobiales bacterium]
MTLTETRSPGAEPTPPAPSPFAATTPGTADLLFRWISLASGLLVLLVLGLIAASMTKEAWPAFAHEGVGFLTGTRWAPAENVFGALPFVWGTLLTSLIALVLGVPVSVGIALFLSEFAPRRARRPVVYVVDLLAAIPSVVFGLWGVIFLAPKIAPLYESVASSVRSVPVVGTILGPPASGKSFFTAGLILALMITPIVTSISREVFETTPAGQKEGALALGATRWEMVRAAMLPHSRAGIIGAVMLGLGRAMGETIATALVIGSSPQITAKVFAPGDAMAAVIANQFGEASDVHRAALIGLGVLLFVMTIVVNIAARAVVGRTLQDEVAR